MTKPKRERINLMPLAYLVFWLGLFGWFISIVLGEYGVYN